MKIDRFPTQDLAGAERGEKPLDTLRAKLAKALEVLSGEERFANDAAIIKGTQERLEAWVMAARANKDKKFIGSIPVAGEMVPGEHLMYKPGELPQVARDGKILDELRQEGMEEIPAAKFSSIGMAHLLGAFGIQDADVKAGQIEAILEGRKGATDSSFYRDNRYAFAEALIPGIRVVRLQTGIEGVSLGAARLEGAYTSSCNLLIDEGTVRKIQGGA